MEVLHERLSDIAVAGRAAEMPYCLRMSTSLRTMPWVSLTTFGCRAYRQPEGLPLEGHEPGHGHGQIRDDPRALRHLQMQ
jgi:hypothetical protein